MHIESCEDTKKLLDAYENDGQGITSYTENITVLFLGYDLS